MCGKLKLEQNEMQLNKKLKLSTLEITNINAKSLPLREFITTNTAKDT